MNDKVRTGAAAQLELTQTEAAFAKVRQDRIDTLIASDDPSERDRCHAAIRVLDEVKAALRAAIGAGKMTASRAEQ